MPDDWLHREDDEGETPVSRGMKSGYAPAMRFMMKISEEPPSEGGSPIHEAARDSQVADVRHLIEGGADLDEMDQYGLTALHWAALNGCLDLVKLLVNRGAQLNVRDETTTGLTPTDLAHWMGYAELEAFLAEHGGLC